MAEPGQPDGTEIAGVFTEKLDHVTRVVLRIEQNMAEHIRQEQSNREIYLVDSAQTRQSATAAHARLDRLEPMVEELRRAVESYARNTEKIADRLTSLNQQIKTIVKILSFIGMGIGAWLIQQILGLL